MVPISLSFNVFPDYMYVYTGNVSVRKSDFLKAQGILRRIFLNFKKAQGTSGRIFLIPRHLEAHFLIS